MPIREEGLINCGLRGEGTLFPPTLKDYLRNLTGWKDYWPIPKGNFGWIGRKEVWPVSQEGWN